MGAFIAQPLLLPIDGVAQILVVMELVTPMMSLVPYSQRDYALGA